MSKTVTLRLKEDVYAKFWTHAKGDNRSLSNFIETSALRYINEHEFVDEYEMAEIKSNTSLQDSLKRAHKHAKARKGRIVK